MPRQARRESGTGIFHVMMWGINHQNRRTKQEQRQSLLGLCLARRRKTKSIEEQTGFATPVAAFDRNFSAKV